MQIYFGIVENRNDPLTLGRCQVRVVGLHTHDKNLLPTSDLPWCASMQPTTSAAMNGIGYTPIGPVEGTSVVVTYLDDTMQQGLILGSVGGIATEPVPIDYDDSGPIIKSEDIKSISLRTVAGPTSGNVLKFYDPNSSRTNLTTELRANMRVVGFGISEGTTIVSVDSGTQITISTQVRELGENIIEFLQPPTNASAVVESKTLVSATNFADKAEDVKPTAVNSSIPTIPPPKSVDNQTKASEGIKALISACDRVGLTTKEQKCSLLGIAGGESGWIPQKENYNYNPIRLREVFPKATDEQIQKYSNAQTKGMPREEFFSFFYGPTFRGKGFLGNQTDADGGKYYGRGFIQLTGRSNYLQYQNEAKKYGVNINLVDDPDSLDADINISALVAALYIKKRTPATANPNASPGYFEAAKNAVGVNPANIAAKKLRYYEYFYGDTGAASHRKDAGVEAPAAVSESTVNNFQPGPSEKSITSGSFSIGFRDPNNKYPLKDYIGESDVNRLARGVIEGTIIGDKDASRKLGIPRAMGGGEWNQPMAPFGAQYPFNKVFESESGHVQEFDDTPGQERINTYHRSGTFTEIDANGTQVNYIVGDNYILMESNGCIHVAGECNITVDGNVNLFARSDLNAQVSGNATVEVGNNANVGVANDLTLAVGGDMQTFVAGKYQVTAAAGIEMVSNAGIHVQSTNETSIKAKTIKADASAEFSAKAGSAVKVSGSTVNVKGTGAVNVDYGTYNLGTGAAQPAPAAEAVTALELSPPAAGEALYTSPEYLTPPPRQFEKSSPIETPDDWNTPEGRAVLGVITRTEGVENPPTPNAEETSVPIGGSKAAAVKADCAIIYTTKDFTRDYRLSKNFTLGMLIADNRHLLQSQMLRPNKQSNERLYTVQEIVCNLAHLAQNVMEPAILFLPEGLNGYKKLWHITSGYRLKGVVPNESPTSDHCKGHCVDISLGNGASMFQYNYKLAKQLEAEIIYDQMILEYQSPDKCWVHIGYKPEGNRRQAFTMINHTYDPNSKGFVLLSGSVPQVSKKA